MTFQEFTTGVKIIKRLKNICHFLESHNCEYTSEQLKGATLYVYKDTYFILRFGANRDWCSTQFLIPTCEGEFGTDSVEEAENYLFNNYTMQAY